MRYAQTCHLFQDAAASVLALLIVVPFGARFRSVHSFDADESRRGSLPCAAPDEVAKQLYPVQVQYDSHARAHARRFRAVTASRKISRYRYPMEPPEWRLKHGAVLDFNAPTSRSDRRARETAGSADMRVITPAIEIISFGFFLLTFYVFFFFFSSSLRYSMPLGRAP